MKKRNLLLLAGLGLATASYAQQADSTALRFAETLTTSELRSHLEVLTSDSLEGRETGTIGQKRAAAYLMEEFREMGLQPGNPENKSYYQPYLLEKSSWGEVYLSDKQGQLNNLEDIVYYSSAAFPQETTMEVVYVGEGKAEDYAELDVTDRLVLIYDTEDSWRSKAAEARKQGAAGVLVAMASEQASFEYIKDRAAHYLKKPTLSLKKEGKKENDQVIIFINPADAARLSGLSEKKFKKVQRKREEGKWDSYAKLKPHELQLKAARDTEIIEVENVAGLIEGSDLKDELLVITAHYDHLGKGEDGKIFRGADDDASGTATVVELAEAFAEAKAAGHGPRRSILFMPVSGEEKGLLGSEYYANNPLYPLENTITNLNIDMVGRIDPAHEGNPDYIYLIGSDKLSQELHQISEQVNDTYAELELDYTYNDENDPNRYYYRSDHYNFAKHNVPVIFYFNGTHADYHKATDTIDKINFEKMEKIGKLIFHTAWELANRDERPALDMKNGSN